MTRQLLSPPPSLPCPLAGNDYDQRPCRLSVSLIAGPSRLPSNVAQASRPSSSHLGSSLWMSHTREGTYPFCPAYKSDGFWRYQVNLATLPFATFDTKTPFASPPSSMLICSPRVCNIHREPPAFTTPFWARSAHTIRAHALRSLPPHTPHPLPLAPPPTTVVFHQTTLRLACPTTLADSDGAITHPPSRQRVHGMHHPLSFSPIVLAEPSDEQAHHIQQYEHPNQPRAQLANPGGEILGARPRRLCAAPHPRIVPALASPSLTTPLAHAADRALESPARPTSAHAALQPSHRPRVPSTPRIPVAAPAHAAPALSIQPPDHLRRPAEPRQRPDALPSRSPAPSGTPLPPPSAPGSATADIRDLNDYLQISHPPPMSRLPRSQSSPDAKGFVPSLKRKIIPEEDDIEEQPAKKGPASTGFRPKPLQASRNATNAIASGSTTSASTTSSKPAAGSKPAAVMPRPLTRPALARGRAPDIPRRQRTTRLHRYRAQAPPRASPAAPAAALGKRTALHKHLATLESARTQDTERLASLLESSAAAATSSSSAAASAAVVVDAQTQAELLAVQAQLASTTAQLGTAEADARRENLALKAEVLAGKTALAAAQDESSELRRALAREREEGEIRARRGERLLREAKNNLEECEGKLAKVRKELEGAVSREVGMQERCRVLEGWAERLAGEVAQLQAEKTPWAVERAGWDVEREAWEVEKRRWEEERRSLHGMVMELKGNIRVFCRVRPMLSDEEAGAEIAYPDAGLPYPSGQKEIVLSSTGAERDLHPRLDAGGPVRGEISQLAQSCTDGGREAVVRREVEDRQTSLGSYASASPPPLKYRCLSAIAEYRLGDLVSSRSSLREVAFCEDVTHSPVRLSPRPFFVVFFCVWEMSEGAGAFVAQTALVGKGVPGREYRNIPWVVGSSARSKIYFPVGKLWWAETHYICFWNTSEMVPTCSSNILLQSPYILHIRSMPRLMKRN
ncbi:hypothetical protein B0H14DRAFT_3877423 [Mycena olivaceomarginata]|nr:hypothetical protein B0H14DRAFT_3877423 [Mycena olivaceomarginata]